MKNNYYYSLIGSFLLFLSSLAAYGQAEVQNPTFPFWKLLGNQNTDTAVNFVGTTDNRGLTFRTNNIRRVTVNTNGNVGIGTVLPQELLHINGNVRVNPLAGVGNRIVSADANGTLTVVPAGANGQVLTQTAGGPAFTNLSAWLTEGNTGTNPTTNFLGTVDNVDLTFRTNNTRQMTILSTGLVGIGTITPDVRLQVNGDVRLGLINNAVFGVSPGYGDKLFFSGGPASTGYNSDNTDELSLARYNIAGDQSDLRMTIGDNIGPANIDFFSIGTQASGYDLLAVRSDGWVGIGTRAPDSKLDVHGKATISRDGNVECCGNDASLALAENTVGTGRLSSISFHNSGLAEGGLALVSDNTGLGIASRRLRMYDNQGVLMGLQITGNLFFGNNDSRSQTRNDAGQQGNAGAQSGFYETSTPSNFPAGASSWWHLIDTRHSNPANNYAMQFSGSFFDQKLFVRKTNGNAAQGWSRIVNSTDASNTNGYLMFDVAAVNGSVEGFLDVNIVGGVLTIVGRNEGGAVVGTWYTLNNVANAKIVVLITNDDIANCGGSARVSSTRTFSIANGGGLQTQGTDIGCTGSDGNNMTFMVAFNPL